MICSMSHKMKHTELLHDSKSGVPLAGGKLGTVQGEQLQNHRKWQEGRVVAASFDLYLGLFPLHCAASWLIGTIKAFWKKKLMYIPPIGQAKTKLTGILSVDENVGKQALCATARRIQIWCPHCIHTLSWLHHIRRVLPAP